MESNTSAHIRDLEEQLERAKKELEPHVVEVIVDNTEERVTKLGKSGTIRRDLRGLEPPVARTDIYS